MATVKQVVGAKTALSAPALATLASATYAASAVKDNTGNQPVDVLVELSAQAGTVSGNKQVVLFAKASLDNVTFSSGPENGTSNTDEVDLVYVGSVPCNTAGASHTRTFSTAQAFGGTLPPYVKYVIKNDLGAVLTAGTLSTAEVSMTVI